MYTVKVTLDHTLITEDLVNYPLFVGLSSECGSSSYDASSVFASSAGVANCYAVLPSLQPLLVEPVYLSSENDRGIWYVQVPLVSASTDTVLYLFFGPSYGGHDYVGGPETTVAASIWAEYTAVYHLTKGGFDAKDSGPNKFHGAISGDITSGAVTVAEDAIGIQFDGDDDFIELPFTIPPLALTDDYSWECFSAFTGTKNQDVIFGNRLGSNGFIKLTPSTFEYYYGTLRNLFIPSGEQADDVIYHAINKVGSNLSGYSNGVLFDSITLDAPSDTVPVYIGGEKVLSKGETCDCIVSEFRLAPKSFSTSYIVATGKSFDSAFVTYTTNDELFICLATTLGFSTIITNGQTHALRSELWGVPVAGGPWEFERAVNKTKYNEGAVINTCRNAVWSMEDQGTAVAETHDFCGYWPMSCPDIVPISFPPRIDVTGPWSTPNDKSRIVSLTDSLLAICYYDEFNPDSINAISIAFYNVVSEPNLGSIKVIEATGDIYSLDPPLRLVKLSDNSVLIFVHYQDYSYVYHDKVFIASYDVGSNTISISSPFVLDRLVEPPEGFAYNPVLSYGIVTVSSTLFYVFMLYRTYVEPDTVLISGTEIRSFNVIGNTITSGTSVTNGNVLGDDKLVDLGSGICVTAGTTELGDTYIFHYNETSIRAAQNTGYSARRIARSNMGDYALYMFESLLGSKQICVCVIQNGLLSITMTELDTSGYFNGKPVIIGLSNEHFVICVKNEEYEGEQKVVAYVYGLTGALQAQKLGAFVLVDQSAGIGLHDGCRLSDEIFALSYAVADPDTDEYLYTQTKNFSISEVI